MEPLVQTVATIAVAIVYMKFFAIQPMDTVIKDVLRDILVIFAIKVCIFA